MSHAHMSKAVHKSMYADGFVPKSSLDTNGRVMEPGSFGPCDMCTEFASEKDSNRQMSYEKFTWSTGPLN